VEEKRLRSRTGQRGDDFPPDQAGFADARDDDAPLALIDQIDRAGKVPVDLGNQALKALRFYFQNFSGA